MQKGGNYTLYLKPERMSKLIGICKHEKICFLDGQPNFSGAIKHLIDTYELPAEIKEKIAAELREMEMQIT